MSNKPWFIAVAAVGTITAGWLVVALPNTARAEEGATSRHAGTKPVARRCTSQRCRSRARAAADSGYYERDANKLPIGTTRWWDEMLRENRAGNPGGGGKD